MTSTQLPTPAAPTSPLALGPATAPASRPRAVRAFARHFAEMVVAMLVGMVVLAPAWTLVTRLAGQPAVLGRVDVLAGVMTTQMSVGMAVWMYHRRSRLRSVVEMVAAMVLATLAAVVPFWLGLLGGAATLVLAHVLMLPAMAAALLLHGGAHGWAHHPPSADGPVRRALRPLAERWPTWVALLVTADQWVDPAGPPAVLLLFLGTEYLVIGALRRSFPDRRTLGWHLVGFVVYAAAAVVALQSGPVTAGIVVGLGWLLHGIWDAALLHRHVVTWRWYAEACLVIDLVVGGTVLAFVLSGGS